MSVNRNWFGGRYINITVEKEQVMVDDNKVEELVADDSAFIFDMPEIPMPTEQQNHIVVEDAHKTATKFAFIGIGRGGSRIAEAFYKMGYKRVCVVNSAKQDLDEIELPDANKLLMRNAQGAGGNRMTGAAYFKRDYEQIIDKMRTCFGKEFDRLVICVAGGGGTGSGGLEVCVPMANKLVEHLRIKKVGEKTRVGLIFALPKNSEASYMRNAYDSLKYVEKAINEKLLSPVILVDNERVSNLYAGSSVSNEWQNINQSVVALLHMFNAISLASTKYIALDPEDLDNILSSGLITYGATPIADSSTNGLSTAVSSAIEDNMLCGGIEASTAQVAGCILAGQQEQLDKVNARDVDLSCFEKIERIINGGKVHRGIYTTNRKLSLYTILGGLDMPKERLDEIALLAGRKDWDE